MVWLRPWAGKERMIDELDLVVLTLEHLDVPPLGRHDTFHVRDLAATTG